jgi:hypothetical protein
MFSPVKTACGGHAARPLKTVPSIGTARIGFNECEKLFTLNGVEGKRQKSGIVEGVSGVEDVESIPRRADVPGFDPQADGNVGICPERLICLHFCWKILGRREYPAGNGRIRRIGQ